MNPFQNRIVLVLGLGASGMAAARFLKKVGALPLLFDDHEEARKKAQDAGFEVALNAEDAAARAEIAVLSPGIAYKCATSHAVVTLLQKRAVPMMGDMDVFYAFHQSSKFIGITGTNGKSTTTALFDHVLKTSPLKALMGGNIGVNVLDLEPAPFYVFEISSFQMDLIETMPFELALLNNITPDHLERHDGLDGYVHAKKRMFDKAKFKLIGIDSSLSLSVYEALKKEGVNNLYAFSQHQKITGGFYLENGAFVDHRLNAPVMYEGFDNHTYLKGAHNAENCGLVLSAALLMGLDGALIQKAIASFKGLAHRQEYVGGYQNVTVINDSKATNGASAAKALVCYPHIYWIIGGKAKDDGLKDSYSFLNNVRKAYTIGDAAPAFEKELTGKVQTEPCGTLEKAFEAAMRDALHDPHPATVLLSPACASYDQFKNFEVRGDAFKACFEAFMKERKAS